MEKKKKFKMPGSYVLIFYILVFVWLLTFIIPSGTYENVVDAVSGKEVMDPNSFHYIVDDEPVPSTTVPPRIKVHAMAGLLSDQPADAGDLYAPSLPGVQDLVKANGVAGHVTHAQHVAAVVLLQGFDDVSVHVHADKGTHTAASTISSRPRFSPAAGAAVIPAALVIEVETVAFP